jgi:pseudouridine synthase
MLKENQIRVNKYLSEIGLGSRRKIDKLIERKQIRINNKVAQLGDKINPNLDKIYYKDKPLQLIKEEKKYFFVNKPINFLSSTISENRHTSVLKLLPRKNYRLFIVGRLDLASQGLMLLTNDGELTQFITDPKKHVEKTYHLTVSGILTPKVEYRFKNGVTINKTYLTKPAQLEILKSQGNRHVLEITIKEGKNQQLRKMCSALNLKVLSLTRISIGPFSLKKLDLTPGNFKEMTQEEIYQKLNFEIKK